MTVRHIQPHDQLQLANIIRSVFEEYGAPLVNTVYDDLRTEYVFDTLKGKNAGYWIIADKGIVLGGCGYYPTEGLPEGYAERFARCAADFEEATYSLHPMPEEKRREVRDLLKETETALWNHSNRRQRFYLKYWMCLHE